MKIAVATVRGGLDDIVNVQFGRTPTLTIVDVENGEIKNVRVIQNPYATAMGGAGVQISQMIINEGCKVVIGGNIGPNSYEILSMGGVDMRNGSGLTVREAVERYLRGELPPITPSGRGFGRGMRGGRGMGRGKRGWA